MEASSPLKGGGKNWNIFDSYLVDNFEYKIQINEDGGIPNLRRAKKLFIGIYEDGNTLEFKAKKGSDPSLLAIPLRDILAADSVIIQTRHMMKEKDNLVVQIDLLGSDKPVSAASPGDTQTEKITIRFNMDKERISTLLKQINQFKDEKVNPSIVRSIALAKDPKLCIQCAKKKYELKFSRDYNLCLDCFTNNYGRIIFQALQAEYYGGHKVYLGGGYSGDFQNGRLILTEHYLIFARGDKKNPSKRWEIIIPLDSVIVERWGIEEISRVGFSGGAGELGIGSGMIYGSGRAHHILVPYVDENGIPQAPRFGLSSYQGEAIRKLASELYLRVVNEKRESIQFSSNADNNTKQPPNQKPITQDINDPLKVLKIRFAKGEITKEQYEDMRKVLES
jgi:hypothetical protein